MDASARSGESWVNGVKPRRNMLKLLGATLAGLVLGLAITVIRLMMIAPTPEQELTESVDNNHLFQLAIRHDPNLRALYLARLQTAYGRGGAAASTAEAHAIGQEIARVLAPSLLPVAPDAVLQDYLAVVTEYLESASRSDADGCYAFAHGGLGEIALPVDVAARLSRVMNNVLAAASVNPVVVTPDDWVAGRARIDGIRSEIETSGEAARMYFGDHAGRPASTPAERQGACLFVTRIYERLAETPAPLRYHALRVLASAPMPNAARHEPPDPV